MACNACGLFLRPRPVAARCPQAVGAQWQGGLASLSRRVLSARGEHLPPLPVAAQHPAAVPYRPCPALARGGQNPAGDAYEEAPERPPSPASHCSSPQQCSRHTRATGRAADGASLRPRPRTAPEPSAVSCVPAARRSMEGDLVCAGDTRRPRRGRRGCPPPPALWVAAKVSELTWACTAFQKWLLVTRL